MSENTLIKKIEQDVATEVDAIKAAHATAIAAVQRETDTIVAGLTSAHEHALQKKLEHMELVAISKAKQEAQDA